ncbi:MAG: hypothetical protein APF77_03985 [Clostridia bacterium BRH_c25]|nr:MAG: hypothetical protein APF77_03985 [Clostridia bacterium BRH_c25]
MIRSGTIIMGSMTIFAAVWTIRSLIAGMPNGRFFHLFLACTLFLLVLLGMSHFTVRTGFHSIVFPVHIFLLPLWSFCLFLRHLPAGFQFHLPVL